MGVPQPMKSSWAYTAPPATNLGGLRKTTPDSGPDNVPVGKVGGLRNTSPNNVGVDSTPICAGRVNGGVGFPMAITTG